MSAEPRCPSCQAPRDRGSRFCPACGEKLPALCPGCGGVNPPDNRFCGQCGGPLQTRPAPDHEDGGAELRRITVLFGDLVGSTELASRLDPEAYRALVLRYQKAAVEIIERFGGHVAQYLGDGILAYFGYPRAHEDDPIRAVHTGLGLVAAVAALGEETGLRMRVGIHTGPVVAGAVGAGQRREQLALGPAPNVAARLQELARPNTVVVSEVVAGLVDGFFDLEPIGVHPIRGVEQPMPLFRPIRPTGQTTRFELARRRGLTALVGRKAELELLIQRFEAAIRGRGRAVLISADAGLGKSRLLEELRARTADQRRSWITIGGSPYHQDTPFHPMVDLARQLLEVGADLPAAEQLRAVERRVTEMAALVDSVPVLATVLGLPAEAGYSPVTDPPQRLKERIHESLVGLLVRSAADHVLVVAVEDLHWIDASTLEVLETAVQRAASLPLLVVMTARPSLALAWEGRQRLLQITLDPLDEVEVAEMIGQVSGGRGLPSPLVEQLIHRADGVPLFVEELTRTVVAAAAAAAEEAVAGVTIPATLEDSLRARLDQLDGVDETLLAAAVIGRESPFAMLVELTGLDERRLKSQLDQLVEADILATRGVGSEPTYSFRHALLQEAAYGSLLSTSRAALHRKIARLTVERFPEISAAHPEITAHHHQQAADPLEALPFWTQAGQRSAARFANVEALSHYQRALACLTAMPAGRPRHERELALRVAIAPLLAATKGYGAPEVEQGHDRALELCQALGGAPELFWTLWGVGAFYQARGPIARLVAVTDQLLREAMNARDVQLEIEAHFGIGAANLMGGHYREAEAALERGIAPCRTDPALAIKTLPHGSVTGVNLLMNLALVRTTLGDPEEGERIAAEGLGLARQVGNPFMLAAALVYEAWRAQLAGDAAAVGRAAGEAVAVSSEIPFWRAWAAAFLAWARARDGEIDGELAVLRASIAGLDQAGVRTIIPHLLGLEADLLLLAERRDDGLTTISRAIASADASGARAWDAELWRLRGELYLVGGSPDRDAAQAAFGQAVKLAKAQGASLIEERALSGLARLDGGLVER